MSIRVARRGESVLLEQVPRDARRILDVGTGDVRLLALLLRDRPEILGVGLDSSELMLGAARKRFSDNKRIELVKHDLVDPLPALGRFDAVVSSMAIHHLEHARKSSLYGEVFNLLAPRGMFANFEHVASPTHRLHLAFFAAIGEPLEDEDPSDRFSGLTAYSARTCSRRSTFYICQAAMSPLTSRISPRRWAPRWSSLSRRSEPEWQWLV